MTHDFQILFEPRADGGRIETRRLSVRLAGSFVTQLVRRDSKRPDNCLEAPPLPLAFWFVDNWWRIRWEPAPQRDRPPQWRLAHHLPSVGAGYPWPNVSIWGEGERCGVAVHADTNNLHSSLRFLAERTVEYVPSSVLEDVVDSFIQAVIDDAGGDHDGLEMEYRQLREERNDLGTADWRRLEAMLGYDPDAAPHDLVSTYEDMAETYGRRGVEEAALAHQGAGSTTALQQSIRAAEVSRVMLHAPHAVREIQINRTDLIPPWRLAVDAARDLRQQLQVPPGPIRNPRLSEVLSLNVDQLSTQRRSSECIPYALRLRMESGDGNRLALRSRWSHGRRFELCRSLGDVIWSPDDPMGPLSRAKTQRQKFQRAFAQEFLCPYEDLRAYIPTDNPAEDDIHAAARHFHVSERMIQTTLVNHCVIDRESFEQMIEAA